jgi:hypothetical protein
MCIYSYRNKVNSDGLQSFWKSEIAQAAAAARWKKGDER